MSSIGSEEISLSGEFREHYDLTFVTQAAEVFRYLESKMRS